VVQRIISSHWFALTDLALVILSGLLWVFVPEVDVLPVITVAIIPWVVRIVAGFTPFKRTPFDWLVAVFLVTAWGGYWAAYDREAAWSKVWFIVLAVLLYYALAAQPKKNLGWISSILFCTGFGIAIYFFLTYDFVALPRKVEVVNHIGRWVMEIVPRSGWTAIHPNYVAGIAAVTTPFILYPAGKLVRRKTFFSTFVSAIIVGGVAVALVAILMATSRGILMAIACAFGGWVIWWMINLNGSRMRLRPEAVFPPLILAFLGVVVLFLYVGPANAAGAVSQDYYYGTGSRGELFARSLYLLSDFPFTGGGLNAFPGLYSHYMLGIPNFNVSNSHNLYLDVAIEQGLLGGLSVLIIFVMSIWFTARAIAKTDSPQTRMLAWLTFFALVIAFVHGMVDDYLYNGPGTLLLLSMAGLSMVLKPERVHLASSGNQRISRLVALLLIGFFMINLNNVRSAWSANLGAVRMAKVELAGFPTNQWTDPAILHALQQADDSLRSALQADPTNRTANHRLGLIALLRGNFPSAAAYLERAKQEAPNHRGIIKSLGYSYVWLGDTEKASLLLSKIPEARTELDIYVWWWGVQGQPGIAEKTSIYLSQVDVLTSQEP
jgi:O-antigen ligase